MLCCGNRPHTFSKYRSKQVRTYEPDNLLCWRGDSMGRMKDLYVEYHTLEFDIENSICGSCEFVDDCRHYTEEGCPNE